MAGPTGPVDDDLDSSYIYAILTIKHGFQCINIFKVNIAGPLGGC